jgi:hypothetical protein
MYNKITLIGTLIDHPEEMYDTDANRCMYFSLNVPPPPDAPPTHWGLHFDLRIRDWPRGDGIFLVISRDLLLVERYLSSLHKGDMVCVEGRLVLTPLRALGELVPLAEILASEIILLI